MLGWEWMTHKAELFGLPIRWATYDPNAPQTQIDQIPAPDPSEDLFNPGTQVSRPAPSVEVNAPHAAAKYSGDGTLPPASSAPGSQVSAPASTSARSGALQPPLSTHSDCIQAASESTASLNARRLQSYTNFFDLLANTDLSTHDIIWSGGDCETCAPLNGLAYGSGWTTPPPLHYNCDCSISVRAKKSRP